jgi:hypothetical protein
MGLLSMSDTFWGHDLGDAQTRAIGDAERCLVLQAGRGSCSEIAREFRPLQDPHEQVYLNGARVRAGRRVKWQAKDLLRLPD